MIQLLIDNWGEIMTVINTVGLAVLVKYKKKF